jgi:hypothetical protein
MQPKVVTISEASVHLGARDKMLQAEVALLRGAFQG